MADKYSRTNFFKQNTIDGSIENDLANNNFHLFEFKRPRTYYTIQVADLMRPDLISVKTLGSTGYWWIIMKLNNIDDPLNDLVVGDPLQIPAMSDIEDFYIKTRKLK